MGSDETHSKLQMVVWVCLGVYLTTTLFSISIAQIAAFIGLIGLLVLHWRDGSLSTLRWPLLPQFLLFIGAGLIAIAFAENVESSLRHSKKFLEPLLFFWIINSLSQISADKNGLIREIKAPFLRQGQTLNAGVLFVLIFGGAALLEACMGLAQWMGFYFTGAEWGIRPSGTMESTISFAIVLMIAGLFSFAHLIFEKFSVIWILFFLLFGLGQLVSFTREAWIGFVVGILLLTAIRSWKWFAGATGIFILGIWLSPEVLQNRIVSIITLEEPSIAMRLHLWRAALDIWMDHPWVGCGFNCIETIKEAYPEHTVLAANYLIHNSYLQLLVDMGLVGLIAWMAIWVKFFAQVSLSFKKPQFFLCPDWVRLGGGAAILAFLVASIFKTHIYDQELVMVIYAVMALTLAPRPDSARPHPTPEPIEPTGP